MFDQAVAYARKSLPAPVAARVVQAPSETPPSTEVGLGRWRASWCGVLLSMATAVSFSLVAALQTGSPITLSLVFGALPTSAGASGLFSCGKKLSAAAKGKVAVK